MFKKITSSLLFCLSLSVTHAYEFSTENLYDIYLEQINISIDEEGNIVETTSATSPKLVPANADNYPALDPIDLVSIVRLVGVLKDSSDYVAGTQPLEYTISEKYLSTQTTAQINIDSDDPYRYGNGDRRTRSDKAASVTATVIGIQPESQIVTLQGVIYSETAYTYSKTESGDKYNFVEIDEANVSSSVTQVGVHTATISSDSTVQQGQFASTLSSFGTHIFSFYDRPNDASAITNEMASGRLRVFPIPTGAISLADTGAIVPTNDQGYEIYTTLPTTNVTYQNMYPGSTYSIVAWQGEPHNAPNAYTNVLNTRTYAESSDAPESISFTQADSLNNHIDGNTGLYTFAVLETNEAFDEQTIHDSFTVEIVAGSINVRGMVVGSE